MLEIVQQTIDFYMKNLKKPNLEDIKIEDESLLNKKSSLFITLYHKWNIRWSSWNVKEIEKNSVLELIENTINALTNDKRFKKISLWESKELKIRIDQIVSREIIKSEEINKIEPTSNWILVLKKDYEKMACILPNIDPKILTWEDYTPILKTKLWEKEFNPDDYIIYKITTDIKTNY